jgi:hypothetical protein
LVYRLNAYIYDYLKRQNYKQAADTFFKEASVSPQISVLQAPGGFLAEWWAIFWDIFSATNRKASSPEARAYVEVRPAELFFFFFASLLHLPVCNRVFLRRIPMLNQRFVCMCSITNSVVLLLSDAQRFLRAWPRPHTATAAKLPFLLVEMAFLPLLLIRFVAKDFFHFSPFILCGLPIPMR